MSIRRLGIPRLQSGRKRLLAPVTNESRGASEVPGGRVVQGSLRILPEGAPLKSAGYFESIAKIPYAIKHSRKNKRKNPSLLHKEEGFKDALLPRREPVILQSHVAKAAVNIVCRSGRACDPTSFQSCRLVMSSPARHLARTNQTFRPM